MVHAREWLQRCAFPFPADPPERVSDRELRTCGNGYALPTELQRLMALELIERRAKDKEPSSAHAELDRTIEDLRTTIKGLWTAHQDERARYERECAAAFLGKPQVTQVNETYYLGPKEAIDEAHRFADHYFGAKEAKGNG